MTRLRGPGGCPWDREQSRETLRPYLIEEAYEVLEAIEHRDIEGLKDELGDLLLQIVFHAQIACERGEFDVADVCTAVCEKLQRRHPHVFGTAVVRNSEEVVENWARIKAVEHEHRGGRRSALAGIPASLPALLSAQRVGERASRVGFDWASVHDVMRKVREELDELEHALSAADAERAAAELGDVLLTLASVGRHLGKNAELTLRGAVARFADRFREMEHRAQQDGRPLSGRSPEELDRLWNAAKLALATAG